MKNDKNIIYIIYPDSFKELSYELLKMSEGVINSFASSTKNPISFRVNTEARLIECNYNSVKMFLNILLKSNLLDGVKNQLHYLLHNKGDDLLGVLKCYIEHTEIHFIVTELKGGTDFSWKITKGLYR